MSMEQSFTAVLHEWAQVFMHRSLRDFKRSMNEWGLSASQVSALMRLYHQGACGVSDIGSHLGVTNAASSQLVERLAQQGLIARSENPADRRAKQIVLTEKGRALIEAGIEARRRWMERLTCNLTPEQQEIIITALRMLTQAARELEEEHVSSKNS